MPYLLGRCTLVERAGLYTPKKREEGALAVAN
jgi:hypothetical protein